MLMVLFSVSLGGALGFSVACLLPRSLLLSGLLGQGILPSSRIGLYTLQLGLVVLYHLIYFPCSFVSTPLQYYGPIGDYDEA